MEFTSIEFYAIAFCVAMGLVGFFLSQKRIKPAVSRIQSLELDKLDTGADGMGTIKLTAHTDGTVTIVRTGLNLVDGETVNLIATIIDDKLTIEEKKGKASALGGREEPYAGHATVDFFLVDNKMWVRYESSVTGQWAKFSFKNIAGNVVEHEMHY